MRALFKYPLAAPGDDDLGRPTIDGDVVHVGLDPKGVACAWICGGPKVATRDWAVIGTGWSVPEGMEHRGTWVDGEFVWHLFEGEVLVP